MEVELPTVHTDMYTLHVMHTACTQCAICCSVLILEDHDCVHIAKGGFEVYNAHQTSPSKSVQRVHQILNLEVNHIMKGGYNHFMQKEIHEQPETLARTMQGRIAFYTAAKVIQLAAFCLSNLSCRLRMPCVNVETAYDCPAYI